MYDPKLSQVTMVTMVISLVIYVINIYKNTLALQFYQNGYHLTLEEPIILHIIFTRQVSEIPTAQLPSLVGNGG